jgi:hypothetical protein
MRVEAEEPDPTIRLAGQDRLAGERVGKAVDPLAKCVFLPQRNDLDLFSSANYLRRAATVATVLRSHLGGGHGANVVDHVTPHRGDWNAFVLGELQGLCEPCTSR